MHRPRGRVSIQHLVVQPVRYTQDQGGSDGLFLGRRIAGLAVSCAASAAVGGGARREGEGASWRRSRACLRQAGHPVPHATAFLIVLPYALVRLADVELDTFNSAPEAIERVVSDRTAAIIPVSLFGLSADMPPIMGIAARCGAKVIEDAACDEIADCLTAAMRREHALDLALILLEPDYDLDIRREAAEELDER